MDNLGIVTENYYSFKVNKALVAAGVVLGAYGGFVTTASVVSAVVTIIGGAAQGV